MPKSIAQLALDNICCQRGDKILFRQFNLLLQGGNFVQIEGHNGIGKTSLLRVIAGLARPKTGKVRWNNQDIWQHREIFYANLLYIGHQAGIKPELTAWENLRFYQQISQGTVDENQLWQVLQTVGLLGKEDIVAGQLSAGQQKRIALARLWLSNAALWLLDEPFNAIDKHGVQVLTRLFEQHSQQGGIVILTSHQEIPSTILQKVNLEQYQ
ncbi:cytochrome c biogenesis heme-transporting ATPase CcmA [Volucribacter amazonae]|uniref:Heme ABC transporter ATP-binding protein CcmA n=1 Tax=Volucribacter amazonae TaxID=256731 RepID=A0A9X4PI86_9PAST|nr:cytochrome c biogenesis heme-transporting ATPase CcmA [Volucribacter amazonae]MDG6895705.1 heme ABC transporter ATP-binding protein CcmA [Volucribacter amazonae]